MTREQGIIEAYYTNKEAKILVGTVIMDLLTTEYHNYEELCCFCSEQPKPMSVWLNEEITPIINK